MAPAEGLTSETLNLSLGALEIGLVLSTLLLGIALAQGLVYFQNCAKDGILLRGTVATILALDMLHTALAAHGVYHYTVTNYLNPAALLDYAFSICLQVEVTSLTVFIAQCFFARRVWFLSGRRLAPTAIIVSLSLFQLSFATYSTVELWTKGRERLKEYEWAMLSSLAISAACDLLITFCLCYNLQRNRTGIARTESVINKLIIFTLHTGLITSIFAVTDLVLVALMGENFIYVGVFFVVSKLYSNSMLASLNIRDHLHKISIRTMELKVTVPDSTEDTQTRLASIKFASTPFTPSSSEVESGPSIKVF